MFGKKNNNNNSNNDEYKLPKYNPKLTAKRKKELEEEIDEIIDKLSEEDVIILDEMGELTEEEIAYIKRRMKKKKEKSRKEKFEASIRCDEETINRINKVMQNFIQEHNTLQKEERIQTKEERTYSSSGGGTKDKKKPERSRGR